MKTQIENFYLENKQITKLTKVQKNDNYKIIEKLSQSFFMMLALIVNL